MVRIGIKTIDRRGNDWSNVQDGALLLTVG
jgi:hypothetical protein